MPYTHISYYLFTKIVHTLWSIIQPTQLQNIPQDISNNCLNLKYLNAMSEVENFYKVLVPLVEG